MIKKSLKVSIMVITYNQENIVRETILSCVSQDYENFEVVVSDDGSSDATPVILKELEAEFPGLIKLVLNECNQGITRNCNVALAHCSGELIAMMGGDDILYPEKIRLQAQAFSENPSLVFCYHPCHILQNGRLVDIVGGRKKDIVNDFYEMIEKYGADIPGPVPMVLRSAIPLTGFDVSIPVASDWLFFIEVSSQGQVKRLNQVLSAYRKHDGNVGHKIHQYADDFLTTVEVVKVKYPSERTKRSANKAARRFLLGVMYRSIIESNSIFFDKYLAQYRGYNGKGAFLLKNFSRIKISPKLFLFMKKYIKRFF